MKLPTNIVPDDTPREHLKAPPRGRYALVPASRRDARLYAYDRAMSAVDDADMADAVAGSVMDKYDDTLRMCDWDAFIDEEIQCHAQP